ncbi:MAG: hypothetical protein ACRC1L_00965, partial [Prochlorococcaceae cyanobacterium]
MGNGQASERHGGNLAAAARRLGRSPGSLLDASASLVPFAPPVAARLALLRASLGAAPRVYPDRGWQRLRALLGRQHGLPADWVLPGNGAAELFTWAARDAAALGESLLPTPGFADYQRALACWGGISRPLPLPLRWDAAFPQPFPTGEASAPASRRARGGPNGTSEALASSREPGRRPSCRAAAARLPPWRWVASALAI